MKPDGIRVIEFEELELSAKHNILSGCRARKCSEDVLTVNPDGTIATCPNQFKDIISNIYNGMYNYNAYECVKCKEKKRNSACMTCDLYRYCNGDCFQQQWQGNICAFPKKLFGLLAPK
jgi:radical SAM protein with 4Fe4S-binding SPASM domain